MRGTSRCPALAREQRVTRGTGPEMRAKCVICLAIRPDHPARTRGPRPQPVCLPGDQTV